MSKDLAFKDNANIAWDLHEKNEIIPLDFTEENSVDLFGIEPIKAKEMVSGLSTTIAERQVLKDAYVDVIELEITAENLPIFKELRLKIMKNRTQGLTKWKEKEKSFYLAGGNFIQAIYNKEVAVNEEMESKLLEAEKFFENQEKQRKLELNNKRIEIIRPFVDDVTGLDFDVMTDEDFDDYVLGKKTRFETARAEAEAEAKRVEEARLAEIERLRLIEVENTKLKEEAEVKEKAFAEERKLQAEKDAEIKRLNDEKIKAENDRLAKEKAKKLEAEKLAKAPIKKQMEAWVNSFELPATEVDNEISKEIIAKYESFKNWSITQINKL